LNYNNWFILFFFITTVTGCQTSSYRIENQSGSINQIIQAIKSSIGEPRKISENRRVYYSEYFNSEAEPIDIKKQTPRTRYYAKISILGDRRPYDIETKVIRESLKNKLYAEDSVDVELSEQLKENIKFKLNKSLEEQNILDDFRVF
jgi:hypothetical protein